MINHKIIKNSETSDFIQTIFENPDIIRYRDKNENIPMIIMNYLSNDLNNIIMYQIVKIIEYYKHKYGISFLH